MAVIVVAAEVGTVVPAKVGAVVAAAVYLKMMSVPQTILGSESCIGKNVKRKGSHPF
jgi:hypothetical protein